METSMPSFAAYVDIHETYIHRVLVDLVRLIITSQQSAPWMSYANRMFWLLVYCQEVYLCLQDAFERRIFDVQSSAGRMVIKLDNEVLRFSMEDTIETALIHLKIVEVFEARR